MVSARTKTQKQNTCRFGFMNPTIFQRMAVNLNTNTTQQCSCQAAPLTKSTSGNLSQGFYLPLGMYNMQTLKMCSPAIGPIDCSLFCGPNLMEHIITAIVNNSSSQVRSRSHQNVQKLISKKCCVHVPTENFNFLPNFIPQISARTATAIRKRTAVQAEPISIRNFENQIQDIFRSSFMTTSLLHRISSFSNWIVTDCAVHRSEKLTVQMCECSADTKTDSR